MADTVSEAERRLLERIAHSDDLQAVQVYADWLLEQDPSRAEFVEIQLRRGKHVAQRDDAIRARVLLEQHWREWLGPAAEVVAPTSLRFEHGVLRDCRLIDPGTDDARLNAASHVQLSTLRRLRCGTMPALHVIGVVSSIAKLRVLDAGVAVLDELTRRKSRIETLLECVRPDDDRSTAAWIRALDGWDGAPNLRAIDLGPLFSEAEVVAALDELRSMRRRRAIPTLRAELRSQPPVLEGIDIPQRAARWVTDAARIATESVDARTLRARAWLTFGEPNASSRLEIEAYNPADAAGLLNWIDHPTIGHVLVRSTEGTDATPSQEFSEMFERAVELWTNRGIEIVTPDAWLPKPPGR